MVARKGLLAPQNTFLDTIAARFDGTREYLQHCNIGLRDFISNEYKKNLAKIVIVITYLILDSKSSLSIRVSTKYVAQWQHKT